MADGRMRVLFVAGTQVEVVKLASFYWASWASNVTIVDPAFALVAPCGLVALSVAAAACGIMCPLVPDAAVSQEHVARQAEWLLDEKRPDVVVVQGSSGTALLVAAAARARGIFIAHVEAGLRAENPAHADPDDGYGRAIEQMAQLCLCPTRTAVRAVRESGAYAQAICVGYTGIDMLAATFGYQIPGAARRPSWARDVTQVPWNAARGNRPRTAAARDEYHILVVLQRRALLADNRLDDLVAALNALTCAREIHVRVSLAHLPYDVFRGVHAAVTARPKATRVQWELVAAPDYAHFVEHLAWAHGVVTDSGIVQEHAAAMGRAVAAYQPSVERPECVRGPAGADGGLIEYGLGRQQLRRRLAETLSWVRPTPSAHRFGAGLAGGRCVRALLGARDAVAAHYAAQ